MSSLHFNVYMDGMMIEVKMGMGRRGVRFLEDGGEWRLPDFLYADDLVLHECILNAPAVSLVLPAFDDIGSVGSPQRQDVYSPV